MNKAEFVECFAKNAMITKAEAGRMIDCFWDTLTEVLGTEDEARFVGRGTFKRVKVAAKVVKNPQNGKPINVPATMKLKFVVGKTLKDSVAGA